MSKLEIGPAMAAGPRRSESTSPAVGEEVQERAQAAGGVFGRVGRQPAGGLCFPRPRRVRSPRARQHPQTLSISVVA